MASAHLHHSQRSNLGYGMLGPLLVERDTEPVSIGSRQRRVILASLVADANVPVSTKILTDRLWGTRAPGNSEALLQSQMAKLRSELEPDRSRHSRHGLIVVTDGGYQLNAEPESIDRWRFEMALRQGQRHLDDLEPEAAITDLVRAFSDWRGRVLADFGDHPLAVELRARIDVLRLTGLEALAEARVARGEASAVAVELAPLVAEHPDRERLRSVVALALHQTGRRHDALALLDQATLTSGSPGSLVADLGRRVRMDDPSLADPLPLRQPRSSVIRLAAEQGVVGRNAEIGTIRAAVTDLAAGVRFTVVHGAAGIGKTTAVRAALAGHRGTVLWGTCDADLDAPYQPVVEALHQYLRRPATEQRLGRLGGELARLAPEISDGRPHLIPRDGPDPATERLRLFDAVGEWLAGLAEADPVVVVVDDLQWARRPTVRLLAHLARWATGAAIRIVVIQRTNDPTPAPDAGDLLDVLHRNPGHTFVGLRGLDLDEVTDLVALAMGGELGHTGPTLVRELHAETSGNPLFAVELVRLLIDTGGATKIGGRWEFPRPLRELGLPESLRSLVGLRLERLDHPTLSAVRAASVLGRDVAVDLVAEILDSDPMATLVALEMAAEAGLLDESDVVGRFRFRHPVVRTAVYDATSATRRAGLHARAAAALERRRAHTAHTSDRVLVELAHHHGRAALWEDRPEAIDHAAAAARHASALGHHAEAAEHLSRALTLVELREAAPTPRRLDLVMDRAWAMLRAGEPAPARDGFLEAATLASTLGDKRRLVEAALGAATTPGVGLDLDEELIDLLERTLTELDDGASAERAAVLAQLGAEIGLHEEAQPRAESFTAEALEIARRADDPGLLGHVLSARHVALHRLGPARLAERIGVAEELLGLADAAHDERLVHLGHRWMTIDWMEAGDLEACRAHLGRLGEVSTHRSLPSDRWWVEILNASLAVFEGRVDDAAAHATAAFELGQATVPSAVSWFVVQMGHVQRIRGDLHLLADAARQMAGSPGASPVWKASYASIANTVGDHEAAAALLTELAGDDFAVMPKDFRFPSLMMGLANVCAGVGDRTLAPTLIAELEPFADINVVVGLGTLALGTTARPIARLHLLLGNRELAEHWDRRAVELHTRWGAGDHLRSSVLDEGSPTGSMRS